MFGREEESLYSIEVLKMKYNEIFKYMDPHLFLNISSQTNTSRDSENIVLRPVLPCNLALKHIL